MSELRIFFLPQKCKSYSKAQKYCQDYVQAIFDFFCPQRTVCLPYHKDQLGHPARQRIFHSPPTYEAGNSPWKQCSYRNERGMGKGMLMDFPGDGVKGLLEKKQEKRRDILEQSRGCNKKVSVK